MSAFIYIYMFVYCGFCACIYKYGFIHYMAVKYLYIYIVVRCIVVCILHMVMFSCAFVCVQNSIDQSSSHGWGKSFDQGQFLKD